MIPLRAMAAVLGVNAQEFAKGWWEGHHRTQAEGAPNIIPGSMFHAGSVAHAASQAAVAFYLARRN